MNWEGRSRMEIRTVAVMGAGAVGSYFIWGLHEKLGDRLWVVADGERKARLEQEGIVVNGSLIKPCVRTPEEARGADLLVVAVKYGALKTSLEEIAQVTDRHTVVMSVLNGVDSEEIVGERIGMEHMVYSVMKIALVTGSLVVRNLKCLMVIHFLLIKLA